MASFNGLSEQPFDLFLLKKSKLYRRSRLLFLKYGGKFKPSILSSERTLGSASLLDNFIEYNPVASELEWALSDYFQRKQKKHLDLLRGWITGVFHEQNHRILWNFFRKNNVFCPKTRFEAYRFLNLVESLVIILDMALGDELDAKTANLIYLNRGIYNPGAAFMRRLGVGSRKYKNALHVCLHTTYLRLEGLHPEDIPQYIYQVFQGEDKKIIDECIKRSLLIEPRFVAITNPIWQKKHVRKVMAEFMPPRNIKPLILPVKKPTHYIEAYVLAENWIDLFLKS